MTEKRDKDLKGIKDEVLDNLIDALDDWDLEAGIGESRSQARRSSEPEPNAAESRSEASAPPDTNGSGSVSSSGSTVDRDGGQKPQTTSSSPLYAPPADLAAEERDEESTALVDVRVNQKYNELVRSMRRAEAEAFKEPEEPAQVIPLRSSPADDVETPKPDDPEPAGGPDEQEMLVEVEVSEPEPATADPTAADAPDEGQTAPAESPVPPAQGRPDIDLPPGLSQILDRLVPKSGRALDLSVPDLPPLDELLDRVQEPHRDRLVLGAKPSPAELAARCEASAEGTEDLALATAFLFEAARLRECRLKDVSKARDLYVLALQLNPEHLVALSGRRRQSMRAGPRDGLVEHIDAELCADLHDAERLELLLLKAEHLLSRAQDLAGAVEVYREAERLAPDDVRPIIGQAVVARHDGDVAELAGRVVSLAERMGDTELKSALQLVAGGLYESVGDTAAFVRHLERAVELNPDSPSAWFGLARARAASDDLRGAAQAWRSLAALMLPGAAQAAFERRAASLLGAQGDPGSATSLLAEPKDRYQWATLFDAAVAKGDRATASRGLVALCERFRDPAIRASLLAELVLRGGADDMERTRELLDALLEEEPAEATTIAARAELARRREETDTLASLQGGGEAASPVGLFRAALMLDHRGTVQDALPWIERAQAAPTVKLEAALMRAVLCVLAGEWTDLVDLLHDAEGGIDSPERRAATLLRLALVHEIRLDDKLGARAGLARALDMQPDLVPALGGLVRTAADAAGRHEALRKLARECQEPTAVELLVEAGLAAEEAEDNGSALDSFGEALSQRADALRALTGAERIHRRTGGGEELIDLWRRAVEASSGGPGASLLIHLARSLLARGEPASAEDALIRALDLWGSDPALSDTLLRLPPSPSQTDWFDAAIAALPEPQRAAALIHAAARAEDDDPGRALNWYRAASELDTRRVDAALGIERAMAALGRFDELESSIRDKLAEDPPEGEADSLWEKLLELAMARGDPSVETERREELIARSPTHLRSLHWLAGRYLSDRRWPELARVMDLVARALDDPAAAAGTAAMAVRVQAHDETTPFGSLETAELAVDRAPEDLRSLANLYRVARHAGAHEPLGRSAAGLSKILGLPRCRAVFELRAAEALRAQGRTDEALEALFRAGEESGHPVAWWMASRLAESEDRPEEAAFAAEATARVAQSMDHQTGDFLRAGRLWLERVGDRNKALKALQGALLVDENCDEAFDLAREAMDHEGVDPKLALELIAHRLSGIRPVEEVVELGTKGAEIALELEDNQHAKELLRAVLAADEEHVDSLVKLVAVAKADEDWAEAAACLEQLTQLTEDPAEKKRYELELGRVAQEKLGDTDRAIRAFQEVTAEEPENLDALRRLSVLLPSARRWREAAEANSLLREVEPDIEGKRDALLRLARAFEVGLRNSMQAQMALDEARRLNPTDLTTIEALVEFFRRQGQHQALKVHLDLAASEQRRLLEADPCDQAVYHGLFQVFSWQGRGDPACTAAAVLEIFGGATDRERELLGQQGGMVWQPGPMVADIRLDEHLSPPEITNSLRALMSRIGDNLTRLAPQTARAYGVGRGERLGRGDQVYELAQGMVTWYGLREIEIYRHPSQPRHWSLLASSPPALILGGELIDGASSGEVRFLLGRAMAILQRKLTVLHQLDTSRLGLLLPAIVKTVAPSFELEEVDEAAVAELGREVARALPKKMRSELGPFALECLGGLRASPGELAAAIDEFADRAGLLAAGGLLPSLGALRRLQSLPGPVDGQIECLSSDGRSGALLRFFVSPEHSSVREKLGLAFPI